MESQPPTRHPTSEAVWGITGIGALVATEIIARPPNVGAADLLDGDQAATAEWPTTVSRRSTRQHRPLLLRIDRIDTGSVPA
ncbi:hypothetical protein AB0B25_17520 [Nocardia sp. NPDC049190]|uniref:hypothetical protein n=1 Tax=Nocardia sp. NPDC049190 TaxID=3155650 RepID=UPI0033D1B189